MNSPATTPLLHYSIIPLLLAGVSRYYAAGRLFVAFAVADFSGSVRLAHDDRSDRVVCCEIFSASYAAPTTARARTCVARANTRADHGDRSISLQYPCVGHSQALRDRTVRITRHAANFCRVSEWAPRFIAILRRRKVAARRFLEPLRPNQVCKVRGNTFR